MEVNIDKFINKYLIANDELQPKLISNWDELKNYRSEFMGGYDLSRDPNGVEDFLNAYGFPTEIKSIREIVKNLMTTHKLRYVLDLTYFNYPEETKFIEKSDDHEIRSEKLIELKYKYTLDFEKYDRLDMKIRVEHRGKVLICGFGPTIGCAGDFIVFAAFSDWSELDEIRDLINIK